MKRTSGLLCALVTLLAAGCGGGSPSPAAPSRPSQASSSGTSAVAIGQPATSSLFGSRTVDLASCLHASTDAACFSGSRLSAGAVGAAVTAPGAPVGFSATASGSTVTLTWTAPVSGDPVTTYVIEAGSGSGASNLANFPTNSTATTYSASGIGAGTYYVRVRAQNAAGVSSPSNESILTVGTSACTSAPNAPGGLVASASGSTVTLTWTAPVGGCAPTAYLLQAGSAPGLSDLANSNTGNAATSYVAPGVGAGTYYVRIRAVNAYGQSAASTESTLVVGGTTPTTPTLIAPFFSQSDVGPIREAFSASASAPWGFQHNGIDFFPVDDLKPFRAVAAGTVQDLAASQNNVTSNWQINVTIKYDSTYSLGYAFEVFATGRADGDAQMAAMTVANGQRVAQGDVIGRLRAQRSGAHVHFGLLKNGVWICPEPYFTAEARQAILDLIHLQYPGANMCY